MQNKLENKAASIVATEAKPGLAIPAENAVIDAAIIKAKSEAETAATKAKSAELKAKRESAKPKPEAKPETPATDVKPEATTEAKPEAQTVSSGLARDATGIVRNATNFEQYSDRDTAYLRFFGSVMRNHGNAATLRQLHDAGKADGNKRRNPFYTGSAKATDVGAINRLKKAGYIIASDDGNTLSATKKALENKAYLGTK